MSYIPFADTRWDEIILGLWQGGHDRRDRQSWDTAVVVRDEFDVVFSLYQRDGHGPDPEVPHLYLGIRDGRISPDDVADVRAMAELVVEAVRGGRRTLVRCQAGLNRSGLVVAFAMLRMGWTPPCAIRQIRNRRSPYALCNEHFVDLIDAEWRYINPESAALEAA